MPLIQSSVSVPASSSNENLLTGSQFEYLPFNAGIEIGVNGDANGADMCVDVYSGQDVLLENGTLNAQNRIPVYPDDFALTDAAMAGERLKIRVRNTSAAGARTVFFSVRLTPM